MKNETKAKIKKILIGIGSAIIGIFAFILRHLLQDNSRTDGRAEDIQDRISKSLDGISESTEQLRRNNEQLRETNQRFDRTNGRFEETNERFGKLLDDIEKTKCED